MASIVLKAVHTCHVVHTVVVVVRPPPPDGLQPGQAEAGLEDPGHRSPARAVQYCPGPLPGHLGSVGLQGSQQCVLISSPRPGWRPLPHPDIPPGSAGRPPEDCSLHAPRPGALRHALRVQHNLVLQPVVESLPGPPPARICTSRCDQPGLVQPALLVGIRDQYRAGDISLAPAAWSYLKLLL